MSDNNDAISLAKMGYLTYKGFQIKVKVHEKTGKGKSRAKHNPGKHTGQKKKPYRSLNRNGTQNSFKRSNQGKKTFKNDKRVAYSSSNKSFSQQNLNYAKKTAWSDSSSAYHKSFMTKNTGLAMSKQNYSSKKSTIRSFKNLQS